MKKLLLLAILPFTLLCACNKGSSSVNSGPTECGTVEFYKNQRSVRISGKKLELQSVRNVEFTDPKDNPEVYMKYNVSDSAFRLNYRVYNVRVLQLEFFEPVNMLKSSHMYIDFYQNEDDISPVYTVGGKIGVDVKQMAGQARMVAIGNINNISQENAKNAYMHIRFAGEETATQSILSVTFGDLTVTSK